MLAPGVLAAQVSLFAGGGATLPSGDFADVAELGVLAFVVASTEVGERGLSVAAAATFASTPHAISGDGSDLYGLTVLAGYRLLEESGARLDGWVGLGGMVHARRSETFPGLDASERGLTVTGGASVSRPVGRVGVLLSGFYTRGLGDLGTTRYPTAAFTVGAGLMVPLGMR
jgi:hypothetical protein